MSVSCNYSSTILTKVHNLFPDENCDIFLIFAQNIACGYTLEPQGLEVMICE